MARQMKDSGIEWIGEIPEDWGIHTASQLFTQVKNKNEGMQEDNLLSLSYGKIIKKSINTTEGLLPESFEGYNIIEPNDIVLRLTDLQNDHTSLRVGLSEQRGIITSAYLTLRNESDCFERYLYYQLHAFDICKGFYGMGAGVRQGLNWDGIKMLKIVRPTVAEQQRIAAFLDRKCAEIDAVIERTKATIEEYKKLKQAVITEAVTKGVRGPRPMKDSGIKWIGEIPEGWDSAKLGGVTLAMRNGYVGPTRDLFFETGIRYIQSLHIKDGVIDFDRHPYYVAEEWANEHPKVHTNDILIVQTGDIGQVGIVEPEYDGCNCHALIIATPDCALLSPRYLMLYLMSTPGKELLLSYKTGALLPHLNAGKIKFTPVLLPAMDEQNEIVFYLDEKCAALDTLIAKKTALLTELETYKKSLIYEYVTGKKEV